MKLNENRIKSVVRAVLAESSRTSVYHALIRKIHQVARPWTSHSFSDYDWSNFHAFVKDIEGLGEVTDVTYWCENGGYGGHDDPFSNGMPTYKRYIVHISTVYDAQTGYDGIKGNITCHFCGTVDDPTSRYDMTANFWVNKDRSELGESRDRPPQPGEVISILPGKTPGDMVRLYMNKYHLEKEDFNYDRYQRKLVYKPRKHAKQKISKPADMPVKDYYSNIVLKVNPKLKEEEAEYQDEVWAPVKNVGRYFKGAADYSFYEVSNHARLRIIDFEDASKSRILTPYPAPTRRAMQFHLNTSDELGNKLHTCPDVKYIVADAFMENFDPNTQRVVHRDGDWSNNNLDNLEVVDRPGRAVSGSLDETVMRVIRKYVH